MKNKFLLTFILLAGMCLYFYGLGAHALIEPDEGRYAEIPREMIETGDFNTPRLNYVKYFEKPALFYWMNAASFKIFGENEFAARFPTALMAIFGSVLTFLLARPIYGQRAGAFSVAILLTMLLYLGVGQINIIDMTCSVFITMSLVGFWLGHFWVFYLGMALALLSKGLIGIVLPGGVVFWYLVLSRQWKIFKDLIFYWKGILLFFAVSVPWFVTVCMANGDFFYFFFVQEHFLRYATQMHDRYQPAWFFIPILILGVTPWFGFLPRAMASFFSFKILLREENRATLFLSLWFAIIFIFFSISSSKLIPYIVPVLPPLAAFFGFALNSMFENEDFAAARKFLLWSVPLFVVLAVASVVYPFIDKNELGVLHLMSYTVPLGVVSALFLVVGFYFLKRKNMKFYVYSLLVLALLFSMTARRGFALMGETRGARDTARIIAGAKNDGDMVAQIWDYEQGLPFYLKQRNILVDAMGELAFGAAQENDPSWFIKTEQLPELWTRDRADKKGKKLFLVVNKWENERLKNFFASNDLKLPAPLGADQRNFVYVSE